jgi:hypothetical protein
LVNDKNRTDLNFSHFFCELGLKMLGPGLSSGSFCMLRKCPGNTT